MNSLEDLLVSYKQVLVPEDSNVTQNQELNKYQILLNRIYDLQQKKNNLNQNLDLNQNSDIQPLKETIIINSPHNRDLNSSLPLSKNEWCNKLINAYRKRGLPDGAIRNLLAKNALESGWGKSTQGKYNYGNITTGKNWKGDYVIGIDHNAQGQIIKQKFRSYHNIDEYVDDELKLLKSYDFNPNDSFDVFINKLQGKNKKKKRYAVDQTYINKVRSVYNSI